MIILSYNPTSLKKRVWFVILIPIYRRVFLFGWAKSKSFQVRQRDKTIFVSIYKEQFPAIHFNLCLFKEKSERIGVGGQVLRRKSRIKEQFLRLCVFVIAGNHYKIRFFELCRAVFSGNKGCVFAVKPPKPSKTAIRSKKLIGLKNGIPVTYKKD